MRPRIAGFLAVAIVSIIAVPVVLALNTQAGKRLAAKRWGGAVDGGTVLTQSCSQVAGFLPVAKKPVIALTVVGTFDANARTVAKVARLRRTMRIVQTLDAFVLRLITMRCGRLAVDRIYGTGLRGFVAKIVTIAKQSVACRRQASAQGAVGRASAILSNAWSTPANALSAATRIAMLVLALPEEVAHTWTTEIGGEVAISIDRATAARLNWCC